MIGIRAGELFGGRYKVLKSLGAGGMGAVYLAEDPRYENFKVALKVIYPGILKSKDARERFRNEVLAAYRVNHKNIVRAFEYFDEGDLQAFAMEYIDGGDLLERMKAGRLSPEEVTSILRQVASGLEAVHSQGIVHRDLKPENIMLTKEGVAKISDFGVARLRGSVTLTGAGLLVGTPKYLCPEYIETNECDHRGDIYALGVMGYEMVAGNAPFESLTDTSLIIERFERRVKDLELIAPHAPRELIKVVQKAMNFSVVLRFQSATEMRSALERVAQRHDFFSPDLIEPEELEKLRKEREEPANRPAVLVNGVPVEQVPQFPVARSGKGVRVLAATALASLLAVGGYFSLHHNSGLNTSKLASFFDEGISAAEREGVSGTTEFLMWKSLQGVFTLPLRTGCSISSVADNGEARCSGTIFALAPSHTAGGVTVVVSETGASERSLRMHPAVVTPMVAHTTFEGARDRAFSLLADLRRIVAAIQKVPDQAKRLELALTELQTEEGLFSVGGEISRLAKLPVLSVTKPADAVKTWQVLVTEHEDEVRIFQLDGGASTIEFVLPDEWRGVGTTVWETSGGAISSAPIGPFAATSSVSIKPIITEFRERLETLRKARLGRGADATDPELVAIFHQIDLLDGDLAKIEFEEIAGENSGT